MRLLIRIIVPVLLSIMATIASAQTTWLWTESIDQSNTWNEPFYKPYNTADKLLSYRDDSAAYCTDCSLPNILWKGIEANKIHIYQSDKKGKLNIQKTAAVKAKMLTQITVEGQDASMRDITTISEIVIYRKPDSIHTQLSELQIEWIALKVPTDRDTISIYLKSKECFAYLNSNECQWVHPLNHHIRLSLADALIKRNYIIRNFTIVSVATLKALPDHKTGLSPLAQTLNKNDTHNSTGNLDVTKDTLLIRLQAIYSADITSAYNRGFHKAHLIEYLLKLHNENKIKGYAYHEAGYFTPMQSKDLRDHLLVETTDEEEVSIKRFPNTALTQLHTLKTFTKISATERITNDWLIIGLSNDISTSFTNRYAIAFKYDDVLAALATSNLMWYSGKSQKDSMRLDDVLRKQLIEYTDIAIYSVYGDIVTSFEKILDYDVNSYGAIEVFLQEYAHIVLGDFKKSQESILKNKSDTSIVTYQLKYDFRSSNNSILTKNTLLTDALLDGIRKNQLHVYKDERLSSPTNSATVLNKLDKTRFYKTGNPRKDSIYISKIPVEDRFIKSSDLKEFTLSSNYTTIKKKSINQGFSFGVFIPAELNPQYETDTLCYVSFNEFANFLQKNKAYKKLSPQFKSLLNERAIVSIENFYDILLYDVNEKESTVPDDLPLFVRERILP